MSESVQLHRLSVRCNRVIPRCDRCITHDARCVYPERAKRKPQRPPSDHPTSHPAGDDATVPALNTILDRLHRLEQQSLVSPPYSARDVHPTAFRSSASGSPALVTPYPGGAITELSPVSVSPHGGTGLEPSEVDSAATLKHAIDQVQKLKLEGYARSVITEKVEIPKELAKELIENYFTHMATDMFLSLVNRRLIELIPDILGLPHVHLDFSIQVLYYAILFHGATLNVSNTSQTRGLDYSKACYLGCLRALPGWKREATGSATDFVAAISMTRVAAECFDYDLAWKMHQLASEFARALNLHNLDGGEYAGINDCGRSDDDRRGFWQLIQVDLYIRLLMDKPPLITNDTWNVNLPWLDSSQAQPEGFQAIAFLISSRITMILMRFFALLDDTTRRSKSDLRRETEGMCQEIEQLYHDWQAHDFSTLTSDKEEDTWVVADCLITGYTCIIFMLRKIDVLGTDSPTIVGKDSDLPTHPLVIVAARHIIRLANHILATYSNPETMSAVLGAYGAYIPAACLYHEVLHAEDVRVYTQDIESLEHFSSLVCSISRGRRELYPFVRAMNTLDADVKKKCAEAKA
ncbi:fungal specific transcription factor [Purpureocillium lavendulum]|uniref:Fungal specific transcription factor n=1 Tax=Purpureocillium lavendulum TaxID=1247861 RepID=A0AB34FQJ2_9HYPO|nr:fungal specific transcription factor [Purpureocillium lavendulum]